MYYDKTKQLFYSVLPNNHLGVSNFNALSDEELAEHGFFEVKDEKPEYNRQTQTLVQGDFDKERCVRHWVIQEIDFVSEKKRKKQEIKASAKRIIEETNPDYKQRNIVSEGFVEFAEAISIGDSVASNKALKKVKDMVSEIKAVRNKSDEVEAILDTLNTIDAVNSIRLEDFLNDGQISGGDSSTENLSIV
jgi:uncharacterized protein YdiU (UPF0061 family)